MNPLLKRELIFAALAACVLAGYVVLGQKLAPEIPPAPEEPTGQVISWDQFLQQTQKRVEEQKRRESAVESRKEFLRSWYQWGAGIGLVLIVLYTFWKPPWLRASREANEATANSSSSGRSLTEGFLKGRLSSKALLMMLATFVLLIVIVVLIAALIN
ncbi:MAG: hypothetical protein Tsb009_20130 [Planctomycetaceae bacterium]